MISKEDKDSIIALVKILHARAIAGDRDMCLKCYLKKIQHILDKYDT